MLTIKCCCRIGASGIAVSLASLAVKGFVSRSHVLVQARVSAGAFQVGDSAFVAAWVRQHGVPA
jgi:hypothetical protein